MKPWYISKQVIQKISAIDKDDPPNGHQFYFSLTAEAANNHNFTLQDNKGKKIMIWEIFTTNTFHFQCSMLIMTYIDLCSGKDINYNQPAK